MTFSAKSLSLVAVTALWLTNFTHCPAHAADFKDRLGRSTQIDLEQIAHHHTAKWKKKYGRKASPLEQVAKANQNARVQPDGDGFINAVQKYPWAEGSLYQIYTSPGQITDIALEPGERLIGSGPIAAGDTVRWIIGDTISGTGETARVHILVKPVAHRLSTNLVINTDRRTYHLELKSTSKDYMASVSWSYPQTAFGRFGISAGSNGAPPIVTGLNISRLYFAYKVSGDKPSWRPTRIFDDGQQVIIIFPEKVAQGELPPLFVIGADGKAQLVNYRVRGKHMIVDRLFEKAELRLGGRKQQVVKIKRRKARARRK